MDRRERNLRKLAKRYGLRVQSGTKHWKLVGKDGTIVSCAAVSASDWRTMKNVEATCKRHRRAA